MRKIENTIMSRFWECAKNSTKIQKTFNLSCRDTIQDNETETKYILWNTCIASFNKVEKAFYMFPSSAGAFDSCISATTKSRLNAILSYAHNVKIVQKNYFLFLGNKSIKPDVKIKMLDDMNFITVE